MKPIIIPPFLKHLKVDKKLGYPIPFFVHYENGEPNFKVISWPKTRLCIETHKCYLCGKKLYEYAYIVTGPIGMSNQCSTDGPMHRECAEYALQVCPHLFYQKAERKVTEPGVQLHVLLDKAPYMCLVKCRTKFKWLKIDEGIFGYKYVSHEEYHYINGTLQKQEKND